MVTRGIRNNNPGNIRHGCKWQGLSSVQADRQFCQFTDMKYGVRAMIVTLRTYVTKYKLNNVAKMIYRWAPPEDHNNTTAYVSQCASAVGELTVNLFSVKKPTNKDMEQAGLQYEFTAQDFKKYVDGQYSKPLYFLVRKMCWIESQYYLSHEMYLKAMNLING